MPTRLHTALVALMAAMGASLFGAGCNLGSSGGGEQVEATRRVTRGVTPGSRMLVIDSFSGDVTLQDTSASEASFTFVKRARAESREDARELLDRIRIEERGGEEEFAYKLTSDLPDRTSIEVQGHIPQGTRLRLRLRNGDVALSGLRGPLDVKNENGDLRIGGAARTTRAETRNGAVEVGMRSVPADGEVHLRTQNGDLKLTLPSTASADIEARTDAGEIDLGILSLAEQDIKQSGAGARLEGEMGEGEAEVRLRTQNGDIELRQGVVRRLPDVGGRSSESDSSGTPLGSSPQDSTLRDTTRRDSARRGSTGLFDPSGRSDSLFTPPGGSTGGSTGGSSRESTRGDTTTTSPAPFPVPREERGSSREGRRSRSGSGTQGTSRSTAPSPLFDTTGTPGS